MGGGGASGRWKDSLIVCVPDEQILKPAEKKSKFGMNNSGRALNAPRSKK